MLSPLGCSECLVLDEYCAWKKLSIDGGYRLALVVGMGTTAAG